MCFSLYFLSNLVDFVQFFFLSQANHTWFCEFQWQKDHLLKTQCQKVMSLSEWFQLMRNDCAIFKPNSRWWWKKKPNDDTSTNVKMSTLYAHTKCDVNDLNRQPISIPNLIKSIVLMCMPFLKWVSLANVSIFFS